MNYDTALIIISVFLTVAPLYYEMGKLKKSVEQISGCFDFKGKLKK
jgi:hypothetical protein